jgi:hypothetical protein
MLNNIRKLKIELLEGVEVLVKDHGLSHLEAALHFCEQNGVDEEQAARIIKSDKKLTEKIEVEAEELNLLKEDVSRLPV